MRSTATCWRRASRRQRRRVHLLVPIRERFSGFADLIDDESEAGLFDRLRAAESTGQLVGDDKFLAMIERQAKRRFRPGERGPQSKTPIDERRGTLLNALSP